VCEPLVDGDAALPSLVWALLAVVDLDLRVVQRQRGVRVAGPEARVELADEL